MDDHSAQCGGYIEALFFCAFALCLLAEGTIEGGAELAKSALFTSPDKFKREDPKREGKWNGRWVNVLRAKFTVSGASGGAVKLKI